MKAASAVDYRELARRRLPPFLFEYIDGGSYAEVTLRRNSAFQRSQPAPSMKWLTSLPSRSGSSST